MISLKIIYVYIQGMFNVKEKQFNIFKKVLSNLQSNNANRDLRLANE